MGMIERVERSRGFRAAWILGFCLIVLVSDPSRAQAQWVGPEVIFGATWGAAQNQVGLESGDVAEYDVFPSLLFPAAQGELVVPDPVNRRIRVLSADGSTRSVFGAAALEAGDFDEWAKRKPLLVDDSIITKVRERLQRYDLDGTLVATQPGIAGRLAGITVQGRIAVESLERNTWSLYDAELERLETTAQVPALRGVFSVDEVRRIEIREEGEPPVLTSQKTIRFQGREEILLVDADFEVEDGFLGGDDTLYIVSSDLDPIHTHTVIFEEGSRQVVTVPHAVVYQIDSQGAVEARLDLPADGWPTEVFANAGTMTEPEPDSMVGGVVVDARGNVYAWRRGNERYEILRWNRVR
jgi:hypothetical protein